MPKLINPKQELFCALIVAGKGKGDAYREAFPSANTPGSQAVGASRLFKDPKIVARIKEMTEELDQAFEERAQTLVERSPSSTPLILARKLTERLERVQLACELVQKAEAAMAKFATDPDHQDVPGIETGIVRVKIKPTKAGTFKEYEIDTGTMNQIKLLNQYIAQELGQWVEQSKSEQQIKSVQEIPDNVLDEMLKRARDAKAKLDNPKPANQPAAEPPKEPLQ